MTNTGVNTELLTDTMAWIEEHHKNEEKGWFQQDWRCKTGMCFAGVACELAGGKWANPEPLNTELDGYLLYDPDIDTNTPDWAKWSLDREGYLVSMANTGYAEVATGSPVYVQAARRARSVLGLAERAADVFFSASNDLDDLRRFTSQLLAGEEPTYDRRPIL